MDNKILIQEHLVEIKKSIDEGLKAEEIEKIFKQKGLDSSEVTQLLHYTKKLKSAIRTRKGSTLVLLGVLILGIGFISCIFIHNNGGEISLPLYGATSIGLIVVFIGLALIFN